ncbi:MAG TPA: ATP synthase F1 subunit epsilon [Longimicrobiales bacterium]|nr:ATP synthase F1 subunit epsilon [Longimicrobiales bacterium]
MPADNRLNVSVISPEATIYEGRASQVIAPAWDGQVGILPGHAPMIVLLGGGELRVDGERGTERYDVSGGFMQVVDDRVTILSETASRASGARRPATEADQAANPLA